MSDFWKRPLSRVLIFGIAIAGLLVTVTVFSGSAPEEEYTDGPLICETDSESTISPLFQRVMEDVAIQTLTSEPVMLHDLGGEKLTVIVTCSYTCPCSDGYTERLDTLQQVYEPKGVAFVALHSNAGETSDKMKAYVNKKHYPLPVYRDEGAYAADILAAAVTPEVFIFTPDWRLQYHGRIDDDKGGLFVTEKSLQLALDTLLMGKQLIAKEKIALGCAIERANP